jgi:hypothetical protein
VVGTLFFGLTVTVTVTGSAAPYWSVAMTVNVSVAAAPPAAAACCAAAVGV